MLVFSIVTPTLNRLSMLKEAVDSVRGQGWSRVEHIIVDGGSVDGTLEWVRGQPDLKLIKGPDRGIYDAMNKGIAVAGGDLIGLLNSDDLYLPGAFAAVAQAVASKPAVSAVAGIAVLSSAGQIVARVGDAVIPTRRATLLNTCVPNSRFFKRDLFDAIGNFSLDWRIVSDRDFMLRFIEQGCRTAGLEREVYVYRQHPGSLTFDRARQHALALRRELLDLARHWQANPRASEETRRLARILEGRSRLGLIRDALGAISWREATLLFKSPPGSSALSACGSVGMALVDYLRYGR
jgi:glycosyltransferase involved in cell wall biosynthesis